MNRTKRAISLILIMVLLASLPILTAGAVGPIAAGTAKVNASALNVRTGAGTNYSVIRSIPNGTTVVVLEKTSDSWYRVSTGGTAGYVSADYLKDFSVKGDLSMTGRVNASGVRWRDGASTSGSVLGTIPSGTKVSVTGIDNGWYRLNWDGKTGYMRSDYVDLIGSGTIQNTSSTTVTASASSSSGSTGRTGKVTGSYVNFRKGPSTGYGVIVTLAKGTEVTVFEESSGWYKISYDGKTGYMSSQYVSVEEKAKAEPVLGSSGGSAAAVQEPEVTAMDETGKVTGSYVNFRKGPSTGYGVIATLAKGTKVEILGKTGGWYKIRHGGSTGYMSADYVAVVKVEEASSTDASASSSSGDKASSCAAGSVAKYTASDLKYYGTFRWNDYRWTWYSEKVLPGKGLKIPGRHVDENGFVCDADGYIVIASMSLPKGTVVATPLGKDGKVYDYCATPGTLDVYVSW